MTSTESTAVDDMMVAITAAVNTGRAGDAESARTALTTLWTSVGGDGDPLHRCVIAHYLADLYDDAGEALPWDIRALDAADSLTDQRAKEYHASLQVRGFYPSLHLNLADNYRRLGSFDAAQHHLDQARRRVEVLAEDDYGRTVRAGIDHVDAALSQQSTARLPTH